MQQGEIKSEVIAAVRDFAVATNTPGKEIADISKVVRATDKVKLSGMEYWEREIWYEYSMLSQLPVQKGAMGVKRVEFLSWLEIIGWDGYKRERTIRALMGAAPNAFFFLMLLRRLNDWVPQVRQAAREKIIEIATATEVSFVVDALCSALATWNSWGRIGSLEQQVVQQLISEKSIAQGLIAKLISSGSGPVSSLFVELGRTSILDDQLFAIARTALNPSVRARSYRALFESRIAWVQGREPVRNYARYREKRWAPVIVERKITVQFPLVDLLMHSAQDRSSLVRKVSAEILIRDLDKIGNFAHDLAVQFSKDKSRAVSERGHFALKQLGL